MRNCEMKVEGKKLHIIVDLEAEAKLSASGKSKVIGSTEGNVAVEGHEEIKVGLNVYTPAKS